MDSTGNANHSKTEARVASSIKKNWRVDTSYIQSPTYGGQCLVDAAGFMVAWIPKCERTDPDAELCVDIRHLLGVMPLMLASGKPLVILVAYPDDVRYVVWRPGSKDFRRYQTPYEEGWQATFPPQEMSPVRPGLPIEIMTNSAVKPSIRKRTPKPDRWRNVIEAPVTP